MTEDNNIFIGRGEKPVYLLPKYATRHGLIAGATGTGKTVTLQILAESFSNIGVPVFMADVKGDLSGISVAGTSKQVLEDRAKQIEFNDYQYHAFPTVFWDLFGEQGHPLRTTVSDMGPLLFSRLLGLNNTQEGVLNIAFKLADDEGLLLLDLKDLRALLNFISDNSSSLKSDYGNVSKASVGAIQRNLLVLEQQGGESFFGEPALELADLMRTDFNGKGIINILAADKLMAQPKLYATFLLWLISELFEELPEVGDVDRPRLAFFFDEAHLLFEDAPKVLINKVEQVVRLIRSKGVAVFFISQNPSDIPDDVLGQLGNRVQHALRAYTPKDQKAVKAAAETFRTNPNFNTVEAITELGIGEALVSTLEAKAVPSVVERTLIRPPSSRLGPATADERMAIRARSPVASRYDQIIDRESAYEHLKSRAEKASQEQAEILKAETEAKEETKKPKGRPRQSMFEAMTKSVVRSLGSSVGRRLARGILGSLLKS